MNEPEYSGRHRREDGLAEGVYGTVTKVVECEENCGEVHYHLFNVRRTGLKGNQ